MISVILEFEPLEGMEKEFALAWTLCTEIIYENFGSLGSRLHRENHGKYIAYAQWPNKEVYENSSEWPEHLLTARDTMRSLLKSGKPKILYILEVEVDLLKPREYK
jgi:hypothetical protein